MISIKTQGFRALATKMDRLAKRDLRAGIMDGIERSARLVEANVKREQLSGNPVGVRSGRLRSSVRTDLRERTLEARVGTNVHYAPPIEEGATIRPKRAKYLTIPLRAAKTAAGKARGSAREVGAQYESTFVRKGKRRGSRILYGKRGNQVTPLFVLVKRVKIKPKRPFQRAARAVGVGVTRVMGDAVQKALDA